MKKTFLITPIICFILSFILTSWIVYGQEIESSVIVEQGSLYHSSHFSTLSIINDNTYNKDSYSQKLYAPNIDYAEYESNFSGNANTKFTGVTPLTIPNIRFKEIVSTEQVNIDGKNCSGIAAGSKFTVSGINKFETSASPGYNGVNYKVNAEAGMGTIAFGYAEHKIGETIIPAKGESAETVEFGQTDFTYETKTKGFFNNFYGNVITPSYPPTEDIPKEPFFEFKLCIDKPGSLMPWAITP